MKNLIRLDDIEYRSHEAIVRVAGKTFTVPIQHDATRARQNQQIEDWFRGKKCREPGVRDDGKVRTLNWPGTVASDRLNQLTITVVIRYDGDGFSRDEAEAICQRIEKAARGRSSRTTATAIL